MDKVTVKLIPAKSRFTGPEFCIERPGHDPRNTWSAVEAYKIAIEMGVPQNMAAMLVMDAILGMS